MKQPTSRGKLTSCYSYKTLWRKGKTWATQKTLDSLYAAASDRTVETRFPRAMLASSRCRPHSAVGLGLGALAPRTGLIWSTLALLAEEHCAR